LGEDSLLSLELYLLFFEDFFLYRDFVSLPKDEEESYEDSEEDESTEEELENLLCLLLLDFLCFNLVCVFSDCYFNSSFVVVVFEYRLYLICFYSFATVLVGAHLPLTWLIFDCLF